MAGQDRCEGGRSRRSQVDSVTPLCPAPARGRRRAWRREFESVGVLRATCPRSSGGSLLKGEGRVAGSAKPTVSHLLPTIRIMEITAANGLDVADGTREVTPEVSVSGACDAFGRVAALVEALLAELAGLSLEGAGRGALRALVEALGRVRAGADAAEARAVNALDGLDDGGVDAAEMLRRNTGSSHREARRRRRRAGTLAKMPKVTAALAKGDISPEHADALARAAAATSAEAVDDDAELLAQVAAVPADRAGRQIQEWTQRNQDPADLHGQHLRQRRRRRLHFGDGDDGMLMAHAAFDRVLGAQFRSLINGIADRIWRAEGGRENPDARTVEQRRLDALAIAVGLHPGPPTDPPVGGAAASGVQPVAGARRARENRGDGVRPAGAGRSRQTSIDGDGQATGGDRSGRPSSVGNAVAGDESRPDCGDDGVPVAGWRNGAARPLSPRHQVVVVASTDVVSGTDPQGRCEIPGVGPIPQTELERLTCGAELFGLLFSGEGEPLWHGRGERAATDAQRRTLVVRDGGCVLCAAEPAWCEAHHIVPWAKPTEGPTDIDNLALLCTACHHRLHDHKRVLVRGSGGTWSEEPDPRYATGAGPGRRQPNSDLRRANDTVESPGKLLACRAGPRSMTIDICGWDRPAQPICERPDRPRRLQLDVLGRALGQPTVSFRLRGTAKTGIRAGRGCQPPTVRRCWRSMARPRCRDPPNLLAARGGSRGRGAQRWEKTHRPRGRAATARRDRGPRGRRGRGCTGPGDVPRLCRVWIRPRVGGRALGGGC